MKGESTALEQCHLRPPPGFRTPDHRGVAYVWRLKSPLHGQGDAGRVWYRMLHAEPVKQGFARSHNDPCLYAKYYPDSTSMDITIYVDDMFVTTDAGQAANDDLDAIHKKFGTTLKENPGYFLGMNITYVGRSKIHLSSQTYVENLEKR